ncbi:hypothetical protein RIF29_29522 [Crotalaria pallida]|uniref:mTERF protein n=1 Tax=Crotalaria pallida TaxID=3830 RepID=A0AAN9HTZ8_CROPI
MAMFMMFRSHHFQPPLHVISVLSQTTSHYPFSFSLKFCSPTSHSSLSFTIPSETTAKVSKRRRSVTSQKREAIFTFFISQGFSDSQVSSVLRKEPQLLSCDPFKTVLPKFEFLASKGASNHDIAVAVSRDPRFLRSSLENCIIPVYESMRALFHSDKITLRRLIGWPSLLGHLKRVRQNLKLLRDEGVKDSKIALLIRSRVSVFNSGDLNKGVDEVKELGFDPSKGTFVVALMAKMGLSEITWSAKVDAFKSWGWSEEVVAAAFRRNPYCMVVSKDKIKATLSFWVNELGWNSLDLAISPVVFGLSLEKRVIPRASVVQYLLAKGLRKKDASLITPFLISEELFLEKYVKIFKDETLQLLKLYQGENKLNFQIKGR